MKKFTTIMILFLLQGCGGSADAEIASFVSVDIANKVMVLLDRSDILANLKRTKENYVISVSQDNEKRAREVLTRFNFYYEQKELNDLLDSKFASLSKLELVKGNLLESRQISNKLNSIPDILRVSVIVTGEEVDKRISVLIISLEDMDQTKKNNLERFLRGLTSEQAKLTVSYYVQNL